MVIKDKITASEFKEIFGLHEKCKITKTILNQYTKYLIGSYLFHHELYNLGKNPKNDFKTTLSGMKVILSPSVNDKLDYQKFVMGLSTKMDISMNYKLQSEPDKEFTPFWTHTHFEKQNKSEIVAQALREFADKILYKLQNKFTLKYGVQLNFRFVGRRRHDVENIWLNSFEFVMDLPYVDENGHYTVITSYEIKQSITNKFNVFVGKMLPPVKRILNQLELTEY